MSELTESLNKQLEQEVEEHNALARQIEEANQQLLVRRGGVQKLQEIINREESRELARTAEVEVVDEAIAIDPPVEVDP